MSEIASKTSRKDECAICILGVQFSSTRNFGDFGFIRRTLVSAVSASCRISINAQARVRKTINQETRENLNYPDFCQTTRTLRFRGL